MPPNGSYDPYNLNNPNNPPAGYSGNQPVGGAPYGPPVYTPYQPQQPGAAYAPAPPQFPQAPAAFATPVPYQPQGFTTSKKRGWLLTGILAGAMLLTGVVVVAVVLTSDSGSGTNNAGNKPQAAATSSADKLFQKALENALSTKSYTMAVTDKVIKQGQYAVDSSDVTHLRLEGTVQLAAADMDIKGYATPSNSFVLFANVDNPSDAPVSPNNWIQLRKNGTVLDEAGTGASLYDSLFSPPALLYRKVIFGNFSQADRTEILSFIRQKGLFKYDVSKISQATVDGAAATNYAVTLTHADQVSLYTKLATISSFSDQRIEENVTQFRLSDDGPATLVISVSNKDSRIVQYSEDSGDTLTTFSDFNATSVSDAPTPVYTWDEATQ